LFQWFYFHRTARGGQAGGKHDEKAGKLRPIAKWVQRTYLWKTRYAEKIYVCN